MSDFDHHAVCDLTTIGRVTGRPHTIEIWFAGDEETIYLLSGGGDGADWVRNLMENPEVEIGVDGQSLKGRGLVIVDADERDLARHVVHGKYQPRYRGDLSGWRDSALPVRIDLST